MLNSTHFASHKTSLDYSLNIEKKEKAKSSLKPINAQYYFTKNEQVQTLQTQDIKLKIKSKEAEDKILFQRFIRYDSLPSLSIMNALEIEEQACRARDSHLWKCIGRKRSKCNGYIYTFEAKPEFNNHSTHADLPNRRKSAILQNNNLFPATEATALNIFKIKKNFTELQMFGYAEWETEDSVYIDLPDREAVLSLYQHYKRKHPEKDLPVIDIFLSNGIASDLSYAQVHFQRGLLSKNREFVHDHHFHIIPRLQRALAGKTMYEKLEKDLVEQIFLIYRKIELAKNHSSNLQAHVELLYFLLGAITDILFAQPYSTLKHLNLASYVNMEIQMFYLTVPWMSYISKRFSITQTEILYQLWKEVEQIVNDWTLTKITEQLEKISDLNNSTYSLICSNALIFVKLKEEGFLIKDLKQFEEFFFKWIVNNSWDFINLNKKGLSCEKILTLTVNQQNFLAKNYHELKELEWHFSIPELFALNDQSNEMNGFDSFFWNLELKHKIYFLQNFRKLDYFICLSTESLKVSCHHPNRLKRILETGIAYQKILVLSEEDQKNLILYSEYLASSIFRDISSEELSYLAQTGPNRNQQHYEKLVQKVKKICNLYLFMDGWEEQPELLSIKEKWLEKVERQELQIPTFIKTSDQSLIDTYLPNYDFSTHWNKGLEEIKTFVAPSFAILVNKIYPFMNMTNWDPVKHRHHIIDQFKPNHHKKMDYTLPFDKFINTMSFDNSSAIE